MLFAKHIEQERVHAQTHLAKVELRNITKSLTNEYIRNYLKREQIIENDSKNVLTIGDEKLKMVPEFVFI